MATRLSTAVETITPSKAEKWLEKNDHNRPPSKKRVNYLANAIKRGEWQVNGDAIRFATNGNLIDGQTRLAAVMVAGKPIESIVIRGLPEEARSTIDIGKPRTNADHLAMAGYAGGVFALASAIGVCLSFDETGKFQHRKDKASPDEMLNYIGKHKRMLKSLEFFNKQKDFQRLLPISMSVAMHYLFCGIDRDKGETFFHHFVEGANLGRTSPILKLRTELITMRQESKRAYNTRHAFLHYVCHAFQSYLDGEQVTGSLPEYKKEGAVMMPRKK